MIHAFEEVRIKLFPENFNAVRSFYARSLQLIVVEQWHRKDSKGVMFRIGKNVIELLAGRQHQSYKVPQGCALSVRVKDVWSMWDTIRAKRNVSIVHDLRDNAWGDTSFAISDPEGFKLTFFTKTRTSVKNTQ